LLGHLWPWMIRLRHAGVVERSMAEKGSPPLPPFIAGGDLPPGIHAATLRDVLERFGKGTLQRALMAQRLERIHRMAVAAGHVSRFIVFGSFVTAKPDPNDVDIFLRAAGVVEVTITLADQPERQGGVILHTGLCRWPRRS